MAKTHSQFLSYNSTGMNTIKTNWIRDLYKTTRTDFFILQEDGQLHSRKKTSGS
jgi:hypothetical protein